MSLIPILEILLAPIAAYLVVRHMGNDRNTTYSQLDRLDGLHNDKDNR
jgi:hypothetical protein